MYALPTLYKANGVVPQRNGSRLTFSSPRNVYRTRDGHYFAVSGTAPSAAEPTWRAYLARTPLVYLGSGLL